MARLINKVISILCYSPYFYLAIFYSFVLRAAIKLGRLPEYNKPDPKELGFIRHRELVNISFEITIYGIGILFLLTIVALLIKHLEVSKKHGLAFFIGIGILFFNIAADPFNEWFVD